MAVKSAAARQAEDRELEIDYSERAGFLTGKSAAIADWAHRKEDAEYQRLFRRLYARNWARLQRERDPAGCRARLQAWREANRDHVNEIDRARKRAARLAELRAEGATYRVVDGVPRRVHTIVCEVCLAETEKLQPNARFCGRKCRNRWHGVPRARARNRGIRNMVLTATLLTVLELEPELTLREIVERMPDAKYGSVATKLTQLRGAGDVVYTPIDGRHGRWALALRETEDSHAA